MVSVSVTSAPNMASAPPVGSSWDTPHPIRKFVFATRWAQSKRADYSKARAFSTKTCARSQQPTGTCR